VLANEDVCYGCALLNVCEQESEFEKKLVIVQRQLQEKDRQDKVLFIGHFAASLLKCSFTAAVLCCHIYIFDSSLCSLFCSIQCCMDYELFFLCPIRHAALSIVSLSVSPPAYPVPASDLRI